MMMLHTTTLLVFKHILVAHLTTSCIQLFGGNTAAAATTTVACLCVCVCAPCVRLSGSGPGARAATPLATSVAMLDRWGGEVVASRRTISKGWILLVFGKGKEERLGEGVCVCVCEKERERESMKGDDRGGVKVGCVLMEDF